MVENRQVRIPRHEIKDQWRLDELVEARLGDRALRWYIAGWTDTEVIVEATFDNQMVAAPEPIDPLPLRPGRDVVVSIIPTGVGLELGGYAGDAAPATRLLAAASDYLVTNPNAVNASNFISLEENVLYTEGYCIDQMMKGNVELFVPRANRVGLIVERTSDAALDIVFNVVNTARSVYGVDIVDCHVTERPIGSHCVENASGAYVGTVDHPETIIHAAEQLIEKGADAIGVTTNIQDLPHDAYVKHFSGQYPNPLGGVEAIMSHLIVNRFLLPAAHAPMINLKELDLDDPVVDARGAGEMSSASGLACVLIGLAKAPQISRARRPSITDAVNLDNVVAVVAPATCLGGIPTLCAATRGIPIIAVEANGSVLEVDAPSLRLPNVLHARNYAEAAGLILALRRGIAIDTIDRPLPTLRHRKTEERHDLVVNLRSKIA